MIAQTTPYNCGPASVSNALRYYGRRVSQARLAKAGTTPDGTNEEGIKAQILVGDRQYVEIDTNNESRAWEALADWQAPVVCCVNRWSHWVCVLPVVSDRVVYIDPAREDYLMREHHVVSVSRTKWMKRWRAARRVRGTEGFGAYYGLVVV